MLHPPKLRQASRLSRRVGHVLCCCLPLGAGICGAQRPEPAQGEAALAQQRQAALAAYDAGDPKQARGPLQMLASKLPGDYAVQEAYGLLLAEGGETAAALPHLRAAAALHPADAACRANYGAALLEVKEASLAVPELAAAVTLQPENLDSKAELGRALFLDKQPARAAEVLKGVSQQRPEDGDLRYDLVLALDASHQDGAALHTLEETAAGARTAPLEALWGELAERAGQYKPAAEHLERAAQLDPSEPNVYALTVEFLRHWTWQAAQQVADFGLQRYPASQRLRFAKGVALYGNTQFAAAADLFAPMLAAHPENPAYADLLGRSCAALGGSAAAVSCASLPAFAALHPENARAAMFAAIALLHGPDSDTHLPEAEGLLRGSLARDPKESEAWYQLGVLQQQRGQWPESAASLQQAIALRPAYAEAHYRLSRAYAHQGERQKAADELAQQRRFADQARQASDAQLKEVTVFLTEAK